MGKGKKDFKFDKMAAVYDDVLAGKGSKRFYNLLLREITLTSGAAVLDVGCGTGAFLKKLSDTCPIIGFGVDLEKNMIEEANKKYPQMDFQVSGCDNIPLDTSSFDIMVSCMAYHHFENKEGFAKEASRLLKPDGVLYIADPRFFWLIRKTLNGFFRLIRINGGFLTPDETAARFSAYGFKYAGCAYDRYAQVVKLKKCKD
ncbi:MAG: class I SAM-dependent methyltransferase [Clostridiales bacterium]|nr:class I SAM-dependent methyltransferase [Clostridiales bacterium]